MLFTVLIGLLLGVLGWFATPFIVAFMGGSGKFGELSNIYLRYIFIGIHRTLFLWALWPL